MSREDVRLITGDCLDVLPTLDANSVDAIACDPPYGLEFMGQEWDGANGFRRAANPNDVGRDSVMGRMSARGPEYRTGKQHGGTNEPFRESLNAEGRVDYHGKGNAPFGGGGNRIRYGKPGKTTTTGAGRVSTPGIGDRETPWPSNAGWNAQRCQTCGHLGHGGSPCQCDQPDFVVADNRWPAFQEWCYQWARECLRVLKPGGYAMIFGGSRTYHRLTCAVEDAGFEIRDCVMWLYGCLSEDTEILVDGRWEPYHKATKGRRALCYDTQIGCYSWQPIEDLLVYDYDDTAYRIESDQTDQIVSRNHRCLVERGGGYGFRLAESVAQAGEARVPVLEDLQRLLGDLPLTDEGAAVLGARYTTSDLARVTPFPYQGKVWCVKVPTGAFVARRNGKVFVTGNSGFPKGKGSLKPAYEPILLCRKPGPRVLPLGIDECRIPISKEDQAYISERISGFDGRSTVGGGKGVYGGGTDFDRSETYDSSKGRWPANIAHDGSADVKDAFAVFGDRPSAEVGRPPDRDREVHVVTRKSNDYFKGLDHQGTLYSDGGSAARFFLEAGLSESDAIEPPVERPTSPSRIGEASADSANRGEVGFKMRPGTRRPDVENPAELFFSAADEGDAGEKPRGRMQRQHQREGTWGEGQSGFSPDHEQPMYDERGRWPSNVAHDGSTEVESAFAEFGDHKAGRSVSGEEPQKVSNGIWGEFDDRPPFDGYSDAGSASRFFYNAKAGSDERERANDGTMHPTVKPLKLMEWVVKLVCPEGGLVLDPFLGSGTTALACIATGRRVLGIERDPRYMEIVEKRIAKAPARQMGLFADQWAPPAE